MEKTIFKNGYSIAVFEVEGKALHVTVKSDTRHCNIRDFSKEKEIKLDVINIFTKKFSDIPTEWHEKEIQNPHDNQDKIIILILK